MVKQNYEQPGNFCEKAVNWAENAVFFYDLCPAHFQIKLADVFFVFRNLSLVKAELFCENTRAVAGVADCFRKRNLLEERNCQKEDDNGAALFHD